jgi:putative membrane protein
MRLWPLVVAALALGLLGTGSLAIAHGKSGNRPALDKQHAKSQSQSRNAGSGDRAQRRDESCGRNEFSAWDEEWLMMSIEGDLFEIQGGKLAQERATSQVVRDLGARLVRDHTQSLADATRIARELGIEVPTEPSPTQQWQLRAVAQFTGTQFDRWYSDLEVQDHLQDIQEAEDEVSKGCNDKVRQHAKEDLPVLQEHLRLARAAVAATGSSGSRAAH